ncbi:phospholipase D family protein [Flavitalea antarctica]
MAEFLTTKRISEELKDIIDHAKNKLILISPYLRLSYPNYEKLQQASSRNVSIKFLYGKEKLRAYDRKLLSNVVGLELFFLKDLHTKCYFNESKMLITSMNLIEYSESHNREMGILLDRASDGNLFEPALSEAYSIFLSAKPDPLTAELTIPSTSLSTSPSKPIKLPVFSRKITLFTHGHCIRCSTEISHDLNRPYCKKCYYLWNDSRRQYLPERFCHSCGEARTTTMNKPDCSECYTSNTESEAHNF